MNLTIYVPEGLGKRIRRVKKRELPISRICQTALRDALDQRLERKVEKKKEATA